VQRLARRKARGLLGRDDAAQPRAQGAGCSYKSFGAKGCRPGATPGLVFECVAANDSVSMLLGQRPEPAEAPAPATPATAGAAGSTKPGGAARPAASAGPPKLGTWVLAGTGDCIGAPVGVSKGLGPARARCDAARRGQVAICWDGVEHKNPALRGAGCSYQSTRAESCRGGPHPGTLYRCEP
jgi:hypothetical protein